MTTETKSISNKDQRVLREMNELIDDRKTLVLATIDASGFPTASYAPFCRSGTGGFLVYISDIAKHARNLIEDSRLSVLLIEDESEADQTYAHRRLTFKAHAREIDRDSEPFIQGLARLRDRHGDIIDNIGRMVDFHLFEIRPEGIARLVLGFGRAYDVGGPDFERIRHLNGAGSTGGHRTANEGHRTASSGHRT